jgi:hypothetical protein
MDRIEFDMSRTGLGTVFKRWQEESLRAIWSCPGSLGSRAVWKDVNKKLGEGSISRASIINFLEWMKSLGVLMAVEVIGRGGNRWIYSANMDESGFKCFLVRTLIDSLLEKFPNETRETLKNVIEKSSI